jgi:hypothetical protein
MCEVSFTSVALANSSRLKWSDASVVGEGLTFEELLALYVSLLEGLASFADRLCNAIR